MIYFELKNNTSLSKENLSIALCNIIQEMENGYTRNKAINYVAICFDVSSYYLADQLFLQENI